MWISVWGCGKLCAAGEGVKINSKIISKKFGGVECLFYFCGIQISERPIDGLQLLLVTAVEGLHLEKLKFLYKWHLHPCSMT